MENNRKSSCKILYQSQQKSLLATRRSRECWWLTNLQFCCQRQSKQYHGQISEPRAPPKQPRMWIPSFIMSCQAALFCCVLKWFVGGCGWCVTWYDQGCHCTAVNIDCWCLGCVKVGIWWTSLIFVKLVWDFMLMIVCTCGYWWKRCVLVFWFCTGMLYADFFTILYLLHPLLSLQI